MNDHDYPRFAVNRSVALLVYKQPFLDWLRSADPHPELAQAMTREELGEDNDIFLIPQFDDLRDSVKWVEKRWRMLFEFVLAGWLTDESLWPENRTLGMFREWFDIRIHTMIWDLAHQPLAVEDWGGEGEDDIEAEEDQKLH